MAGETGVYLYLAGAVAVGFLWGKVSSRIPMPELLRLLGTFVCTGILGVIFGFVVGIIHVIFKTPRVEDWLGHPFPVLVQQAFLYACGCFLVGAVLGGPSILGFAFGYRKPRAE